MVFIIRVNTSCSVQKGIEKAEKYKEKNHLQLFPKDNINSLMYIPQPLFLRLYYIYIYLLSCM